MGFGCGSLAGLLFAPKSGSATRAEIARAGKRRQRLIKKQVSPLRLPSRITEPALYGPSNAHCDHVELGIRIFIVALIARVFGFAD
jgi:hypothetical protein